MERRGKFFLPPYHGVGKTAVGGGALRMIAGADLGRAFPNSVVHASGSALRDDVPTTADVTQNYLLNFGISPERVRIHRNPVTTSMEVLEVVATAASFSNDQRLIVCTNDYHIPRAAAMFRKVLNGELGFIPWDEYENRDEVVETSMKAAVVLRQQERVRFVSAEDVLHITRPQFERVYQRIRQTAAYAQRVALEAQGLQDLQNGTYSAKVNERSV